MGFWNKRQSADQNEQAARSTTNQSRTTQSTAEQSTHQPSMGRQWRDIERAEEHFGMQIPDVETLQRLNHQEQTFGREAHEWIAEGMPVDIMGKTRDMNAFRQRQAERPPEVPKTIERQNRRSVLRNEKAATETELAGETGVPEPVRAVTSSCGRSLDGSIQRAMEDRMGDSFGDVRIHTGPSAAEACEAINARAFTVGNHIAFNQGEYDPESPEGQHVLAHELAHVRQQTEGAVSMLPQEDVELEVDPDSVLEREAEQAAQEVMTGGKLGIQQMRSTDVHVQRIKDFNSNGPNHETGSESIKTKFSDQQLQKKFKHAKYFGVKGNWNQKNKKKFKLALQDHISDAETERIMGTYRGEKVIHFYNSKSDNNVITTRDEEFISGWKLSTKQRQHLLDSGDL